MNKKLTYILCSILLILIFLDFVVTVRGLNLGYQEGNHFVRKVIENYGIIGFITLWVLAVIIVVWHMLRTIHNVEQGLWSKKWYLFMLILFWVGIVIRVFVVMEWIFKINGG